jgi:hypothetical protein
MYVVDTHEREMLAKYFLLILSAAYRRAWFVSPLWLLILLACTAAAAITFCSTGAAALLRS